MFVLLFVACSADAVRGVGVQFYVGNNVCRRLHGRHRPRDNRCRTQRSLLDRREAARQQFQFRRVVQVTGVAGSASRRHRQQPRRQRGDAAQTLNSRIASRPTAEKHDFSTVVNIVGLQEVQYCLAKSIRSTFIQLVTSLLYQSFAETKHRTQPNLIQKVK